MRGMLWESLLEASRIVEDPDASEERKLRAMHALAQLSGCYLKAIEVGDLAREVADLQAAMKQYRRRA
jgi:hypothetical protein